MNLLELLNQSDIIPAKSYYTFKLAQVEVKVPIYGDISGEEAEELDALERKTAEWQSQFYTLLERIAIAKGINEPFKLMQKLEQLEGESIEAKADYLGDYFGELIKLQGQRQSNLEQTKIIALLALKRVDRNMTLDHLAKLPQKLLIDLADLIIDEQRVGAYDARSMVEAKLQAVTAEAEGLREIVNSVSTILEPILTGNTKTVNTSFLDPLVEVFAKHGYWIEAKKKRTTKVIETAPENG